MQATCGVAVCDRNVYNFRTDRKHLKYSKLTLR